MFKTQIIDAHTSIDIDCAEETHYEGEPTLVKIQNVVEWALEEAWDDGEISLYDLELVSVAVWHDDVFLGVYHMRSDMRPHWHSLTKRPG
jgi:hypothetical protein